MQIILTTIAYFKIPVIFSMLLGFLLEECPEGVEKIGIESSSLTLHIGLFSIYYRKL
jgi:hypothetical protein